MCLQTKLSRPLEGPGEFNWAHHGSFLRKRKHNFVIRQKGGGALDTRRWVVSSTLFRVKLHWWMLFCPAVRPLLVFSRDPLLYCSSRDVYGLQYWLTWASSRHSLSRLAFSTPVGSRSAPAFAGASGGSIHACSPFRLSCSVAASCLHSASTPQLVPSSVLPHHSHPLPFTVVASIVAECVETGIPLQLSPLCMALH